MAASRTALLLGATGLVGRHCLDRLLETDTYGVVVTLGRRALERAHPRLAHHIVDFDRLDEHAALLAADDVFCCLGTTIKQAGSDDAFRRVDFTYVVEAARLARAQGATQFLLVSALGADSRSRLFYPRIKGEAEDAVRALGFERVALVRPSLLLGERATPRTGERVAERVLGFFSFALRGPLAKYRPIAAETVARALVNIAIARPGGVRVYEPAAIRAAA